MAESLGTYYFQVAPSAEGIQGDISDMLNGADGIGGVSNAISGGFTQALGLAGTAIAGVTAAATAMAGAITAGGAAFLDATSSAAQYGDNIDKMSQKMGISSESFQEWQAVMQHSGTSMEALKASMKTMATAAENGNEAFQALGITEEELATLSQEDLFSAVITGLQNMGESTERTYIAGQLLGRGATELGALLNTSAEETQAMKDRLHELGAVMSDEDVKASAAFQDSLQDMSTGFEALQRNIATDFLPSMTQVMDGVSDLVAGDEEKGFENITAGIEDFISNLSTLAPKILKVGGSLIGSLAQSILTQLPTLVSVGAEQVIALVAGISDQSDMISSVVVDVLGILVTTGLELAPQLLSLGSDLLMNLANGIAEAIPTMMPIGAQLIGDIITMILTYLPQIESCAFNLIEALGEGLMASLPALISMLPAIVGGIVNFFQMHTLTIVQVGTELLSALVGDGNLQLIINSIVEVLPLIIDAAVMTFLNNIPLFIDAGFQLFTALITNLPEIIIALVGAIPQIKDALLQELANLIVAFEDIGKDIMMGLADGIVSAGDAVVESAKNVIASIPQTAKDVLQINSPSKVFEGFGEYLDLGLAVGIANNADIPQSAMETMSNDLINSYEPAVESSAPVEKASAGDIVIPVYIGQERIDEIIVTATDRANYKSGGR